MVLDHVTECAIFIIIGPTVSNPFGLGHCDLDVVNREIVPQRLKERIGKSQGDQVLDGFLAQIVIDAEDALFGEDCAHRPIDHARTGQIPADGLFQHDAGCRPGHAR